MIQLRESMMSNYIKSPLNYTGGKHKLLSQIIPYFPVKIRTFVDLFAGGYNVGINIDVADSFIVNDINNYLIEILQFLYVNELESIINKIEERILIYGLSKDNSDGYNKLRDDYNKKKDPLDLFALLCFSYNHLIRFNNSHQFNTPFGKNRSSFNKSTKSNLSIFTNKMKSQNILFTNSNFLDFNYEKLGTDDFLYCDPPYLITTASYNDGKRGFSGWGINEEKALLEILDKLNDKGVKFALSNVLEHKGITNHILLKWSDKYRVIEIDSSYTNSSYNTNRSQSREVLIINY